MRARLLLLACMFATGCALLPAARPSGPTPTPAPGSSQTATSPTATTPSDLPTTTPSAAVALGLDHVSLAPDGRSVEVTFVGAAPMAEPKPCAADYAHSEAVVDTTLELTVTEAASRNGACHMDEFICCARTFTVDLPPQVDRVRDMGRRAARMDWPSAGLFFLERPFGVRDLHGLPQGWKFLGEEANWGGSWTRFYGSVHGSNAGSLEFRTSFDSELNSEPEVLQPPVLVNGREAEYSLYGEDTGEITLQWMDGDNALMLLGQQRDFNIDDLIALAETATPIPTDAP